MNKAIFDFPGLLLALALLLLVVIVILWLRAKLTEKRFSPLTDNMPEKGEPECELEFPEDSDTLKADFVGAYSGDEETGTSDMPMIFLQADCFNGPVIPLLSRSGQMLPELIIARKTEDGRENEFRKTGSVYLCVSPGKQVVSRPNENRRGHARIYHSGERQYSIEDLGSKVGTFVNGKPIRGVPPVTLQDGDTIEIGGKNGIAIIFKYED